MRERLNGTYEFTLADVENFSLFIGVDPEDFIASIDRALLEQSLPERETPPLRAVPLADAITGGRRRTVSGSSQDDLGGEDYDVELADVTKKNMDLAAKRGTKKADQEPAD